MEREIGKSGVERLRKNTTYKRKKSTYKGLVPYKKPEPSEDTVIRKDINKIIMDMINQNKGDIEIEVYIRNKYPNYADYIPKMISHHSNKLRKIQVKKAENIKSGDER